MQTKKQHADQFAKGGLLGVFVYFAQKYNLDPEVTAVLVPVVAAVLSLLSTKVGDPNIASFFAKALVVEEPKKAASKKKARKK